MIDARELPEHFLAQGRITFTLDEAVELLDLKRPSAKVAVSRLRAKRLVFSPAQGFYVLVPVEYRAWGVVPADWFIDELFRFLDRPYYVALLSAAAHHGASHHAPQVFQVMTSRQMTDRDFERVRLRFYESSHIDQADTARMTVQTGEITVSSREMTVVDLVSRPGDSGGIDNVATIIKEIGPLHGSALARLASPRKLSVVRRVGWMVERFGQVDDLEALRQAARRDQGDPSPLDPGRRHQGRTDKSWALRINREVEPEL